MLFLASVILLKLQALLVSFGIYTFWRLQLQHKHLMYKLGFVLTLLYLLATLIAAVLPAASDVRIATAVLLCLASSLMFIMFSIIQQQLQMKTAAENDNFGQFSSAMLVLFVIRTAAYVFYAVLHLC
eukprot:TRINITY_DN13624_c0_g1_i1.p2 TRINITY_DN13624_c0_g1~~TRINITY_DN13624_c0_g1_i1.p2  ORF type:complete len:127 (-),score=19.90 TRINITY_DN13624_c0_g1_i1:767-1147(-)